MKEYSYQQQQQSRIKIQQRNNMHKAKNMGALPMVRACNVFDKNKK